ncbi:MAG: hypothetical protein WCJ30_26150 [Deltaproteobacteria bacterium]
MDCWEFMGCGREAGGARSAELGDCPASPDCGTDCARVAGTLCGGDGQGSFAEKLANCIVCEFYRSPNHRKTIAPGRA